MLLLTFFVKKREKLFVKTAINCYAMTIFTYLTKTWQLNLVTKGDCIPVKVPNTQQ